MKTKIFVVFIALFTFCSDEKERWYDPWNPMPYLVEPYHKSPAISSNGVILAYTDYWGINVENMDGTGRRFLCIGTGADFSPDGKWIVFCFHNECQIYKIKVNGDSLTQLTFRYESWAPSCSPDGKKIAYQSTVNVNNSIRIMDLSGQNDTVLISEGMTPSWSADGKKIAYATWDGIFIADSNGKNLKLVHQGGTSPIWSRDGTRITFYFEQDNGSRQIWVVDTNGQNLKQLTKDGARGKAVWTPDNKIIFTFFNGRDPIPGDGYIWIMEGNGSNKRQLTY